MKCKQCNSDLNVSNCKMESEVGTDVVEAVQTLVCVNPKCSMYCGGDLTNPLKVAEVIRTQV